MIPAAFLQDLLARADIVEVVGRHVELKKAGINHKGLCPFHGEKSPSFIVSPSRQTYHCFGCGAHGDAIRFLTEQAGLGFPDAVAELAGMVGLQVPQEDLPPGERERVAQLRAHQATLGDVLGRAARHYRDQLKASPRAIDYLKRRGLTGTLAARFGLGYAPEGWRGLASVYPRYDDPLLAESGLVIVQGDEGPDQKRYDRFRDRIMFPIRAVKGEVIGFGGRVLDQGEPKYLNSPETPVFSKGRELYGLFEARQSIRAMGYVLVVEGYMDVVALAQAGLANAVATLGTACTADHVHKLFRHADNVVFSFDGDAAGRRAAARALEAALPHATDVRSVRFLFLPSEHDPDSFVREHGREAFDAAVAAAVPLSRQLIDEARAELDLGSAEGRAKMLARARPLWQALPEGVLRSQVLAELAAEGQMPAPALEAAWASSAPSARAQAPAAGSTPAYRPLVAAHGGARRPLARAAATVLDRAAWLLARHPALWLDLAAADQSLLADQPSPYGALFCRIDRCVHEHGDADIDDLLGADDRDDGDDDLDHELPALLQRIRALHEVDDSPSAGGELAAVLMRLRQQAVDDELQVLMESGELSEPAAARRRELLARRAELKRRAALPSDGSAAV